MRWGLLALAAYVGQIVLANVAISHWGWCSPPGPCLVPVGGGLMAPSGILFVAVALALRDLIQERLGRAWTVAGILAGAALSWWVETPALAVASGLAFLLSEATDLVVYTPIRDRGWHPAAVLASGVAGSVVDSAVFLQLAFASQALLPGQVAGKVEITAVCAAVAWLWHHWHYGERRRQRDLSH